MASSELLLLDRSEDQKRRGGEWCKKNEMRLGGNHGQRRHRGRPTWAEAAQRAADRAEWRTLVHALCDTWRPRDP